ncbi:MAG: hypothetical protein PVJ60_03935, partial [Phycisphaerales bacterium]
DWIANSQFVKATGLKRPNVTRAIRKLQEMNLIVIKKDNRERVSYSLQKDYTKWKPLSKKIMLSKKIRAVIKKDNKLLSKKMPTKDNKDNITKDNNKGGKKPPKNPDLMELKNHWFEEYKKRFGDYGYDYGKDDAILNRLIKQFSDVGLLRRMIVCYLDSKDEFMVRQGKTIPNFKYHANKINQELTHGTGKPKIRTADEFGGGGVTKI